jgi:hypothetical protein
VWYLPKPGSADLLQLGSAGQRGRCPGHERRQATRPDPLETPLLIITRILIDLVINVGVRISPPGEQRCHAVRRTRHRVGAGARARTLLSSLMSLLPRPGRCTPASPDASSEPRLRGGPAVHHSPPSLDKEPRMPRVIITTDPSPFPADASIWLDERVQSVHLSTDHAAAQFVERLAWAIGDAENAEDERADPRVRPGRQPRSSRSATRSGIPLHVHA